eukprot:TRINITY_DN2110_c0_g1_i3.p3 TRINITY_DN2110_c0_g1~~TRINITY_DN2110_c0_g1_i3.p3  ORF type:complete len:194 (-),score=14.79 TRINITY_DN2110_c0_g1_i3:85-666(-)
MQSVSTCYTFSSCSSSELPGLRLDRARTCTSSRKHICLWRGRCTSSSSATAAQRVSAAASVALAIRPARGARIRRTAISPDTAHGLGLENTSAQSVAGLGLQNTSAQLVGGPGLQNTSAQSVAGLGLEHTSAQSVAGLGLEHTIAQSVEQGHDLLRTTLQLKHHHGLGRDAAFPPPPHPATREPLKEPGQQAS